MDERRFFSFRTILLGLLVSFALAAAAAVYLYYVYIQYDRVAALHLAPGTRGALRLDLEKVVLYEPIRRHVLPLANERRKAANAAPVPAAPSRLDRVQAATRIELGVDLRELVLGWGPGPTDWVLVVGGRFPREGVIEGLERVFREEGAPWTRSSDGAVLVSSGGIALGQAKDGSLIGASREEVLRSALPANSVYEQLGLSREGAGGYALDGDALRTAVPPALRLVAPPLGVVDDVRSVRGDIALGAEVTLTSQVQLRQATAPAVAEQLGRLSSGARGLALLPGAPQGALRAVERLQTSVEAPDRVRVTASWSRDEVDAAAAELANLLRALFGWS